MSKDDKKSEEDQPKAKFKIVDRRGVESEPEEIPVKAPAPAEKQAPIEEAPVLKIAPDVEGEVPDSEEDVPQDEIAEDPLGFRNVGLSFLQTLATIAWVQLGLLPHPQTQLVVKKMDEARKTIGLLEVIFHQLQPEYPPEVNSEIVRLIADLKAAYVNQL
jgi:hypothetical protein